MLFVFPQWPRQQRLPPQPLVRRVQITAERVKMSMMKYCKTSCSIPELISHLSLSKYSHVHLSHFFPSHIYTMYIYHTVLAPNSYHAYMIYYDKTSPRTTTTKIILWGNTAKTSIVSVSMKHFISVRNLQSNCACFY